MEILKLDKKDQVDYFYFLNQYSTILLPLFLLPYTPEEQPWLGEMIVFT